jgi:hypothetical protein
LAAAIHAGKTLTPPKPQQPKQPKQPPKQPNQPQQPQQPQQPYQPKQLALNVTKLQASTALISPIKTKITEMISYIEREVSKDPTKAIPKFTLNEHQLEAFNTYNEQYERYIKYKPIGGVYTSDQAAHFAGLERNLTDLLKELGVDPDEEIWTGGSRSKSKFSRKQRNHLSGKNRRYTIKRLNKKHKTNKNRNGNNIRKNTQKRN